ncbi:uncharacterized protein [Euphorbia lathyris]|uniref:uncharacterized protein isoform X2 n=1 Tax=Euphorbia lathyris TaxID=212925 RepID=UPI0033131A7D
MGWNTAKFKNVPIMLKSKRAELEEIQRRADPTCKETETTLAQEILELEVREEIIWKQRSKCDWLKKGDHNTSFFHAKCNQRRRTNKISCLENNVGEMVQFDADIENVVTDYFSKLFQSSDPVGIDSFLASINSSVSGENQVYLSEAFFKEEIVKALEQINAIKAPGPDDDPLIFGRANVAEISTTQKILEEYEVVSGQMINFDKSEIFFSHGVLELRRNDLANQLGVKITGEFPRYIGLPTMIRRKKKASFIVLKDRIKRRLQGLEERRLSTDGTWEALRVFKRGLMWRIGDGESIDIWGDNWIPSLNCKTPILCLEHHKPKVVAELIDVSIRDWDRAQLRRFFCDSDINEIVKLKLSYRLPPMKYIGA